MFRRAVAPRRWRTPAALGAAAALAASAVVAGGGPAMAVSRAHVCGTEGTGNSWGVDPGASNEVNATHFTKKPPGCVDFNLVLLETDTGANDRAEGLYLSGSTWHVGSKGFVPVKDATLGDWVLLTNVATGTVMKVWSGGQDFITVDY